MEQTESLDLEVESINVSYGDVRVLWDVSFKVASGQIVSLVGSNGAGKTTILKTIAGILKPSSGNIIFRNNQLSGLSTEKIVNAGIVYVPEGRGIFPEMSVAENLDMGSYARHARKRREQTIERVYKMFPKLKERRTQAAGTLSGGEAQMLAIGRGMMAIPKLLMLDEPSAGLAPIVVDKIFATIEKLREEGITILMVEQDAGRALRMCDAAYVLETGRVKVSGKGEELLTNSYVRQAYLGV
ncbi:MAG: ABC transporter ATP-binding protein, partial [Nitrososphaerota archaeon]|nr:ABC transporter ATP-binding protein [Nitrososphaerota archaeon]